MDQRRSGWLRETIVVGQAPAGRIGADSGSAWFEYIAQATYGMDEFEWKRIIDLAS
jgi:hypothetical protein